MSAAPREADACACGHVHSWHFIIRGQNDRACSACGCDAFTPETKKPYEAPRLRCIGEVDTLRTLCFDAVRLLDVARGRWERTGKDADERAYMHQLDVVCVTYRAYVRRCLASGVTP